MKKVIKTLVLMVLSSLTLAVNVQALTSTTSSHTYGSSYSTNIQKGEDKLINASELVNYFNTYEQGFENTIDSRALFYTVGTEALTSGASLSYSTVSIIQ